MNQKSAHGLKYFGRACAVSVNPVSHLCAVCCQEEFSEGGSYEICETCGWEDDPVQLNDPSFSGGANQMSLQQAHAYWTATGKRVAYSNGSDEMNDIQRTAISLIEAQK